MIEFIVARDLLAPDSPAVTRVGDDDDDRRGEILEDGRRSWLVRMFMTTKECLTVRKFKEKVKRVWNPPKAVAVGRIYGMTSRWKP